MKHPFVPPTRCVGIPHFSLRPLSLDRDVQCLDEIQQQYDALMAEGILPASLPLPTPSTDVQQAGGAVTPERGEPTASGEEGAGVGAGGEPDADLELDGDAGGPG